MAIVISNMYFDTNIGESIIMFIDIFATILEMKIEL